MTISSTPHGLQSFENRRMVYFFWLSQSEIETISFRVVAERNLFPVMSFLTSIDLNGSLIFTLLSSTIQAGLTQLNSSRPIDLS